jgi:trigger factor
MQVTETQSEGLKHEFQVVVSAEDIEAKLMGKLTELAQTITLPGFRPGKVPVTLLRKTYGKRVLGEVLEETVNETVSRTLEENELRPALQPQIEVTSFDDGTDLEYTMAVEVMPEFETGNFSDIKLERLVAEVEEGTVDERIAALAEQMKSFVDAADGETASEGDSVVIDFLGKRDGEPFQGGAAEDFQLELGSGRFIPGFEEQLVGAKKDESRDIQVTFPEDYQQADLAGVEVTFEVTVKAVKVPLPVAIDDALAEKLGLENLESLKSTIQQQLESEYGQISRARLKRSLLDALAERHDFALPAGMVDMEFDSIWQQLERELEQQSKSLDEMEEPEDKVREEYRTIAERRVRLGLLLSEVGRQNNIEVGQDEVNRAIMERARGFPGQEQSVFEFYQKNPEQQADLRAPIIEEKVCDYIIDMAEVSERKVEVAELLADPDGDDAVEASEDGNEQAG